MENGQPELDPSNLAYTAYKQSHGYPVMDFMPKLRKFLKEQGKIYTVRKYRMDNKEIWVEEVGICSREFICELSNLVDLKPYVIFSGFINLEDWMKAARKFIGKEDPKYLYKVTRMVS